MANDHKNSLGALAAGRLLTEAAGGKWGPAIVILAGIILLRRWAAARAVRRNRLAAPDGSPRASVPHRHDL